MYVCVCLTACVRCVCVYGGLCIETDMLIIEESLVVIVIDWSPASMCVCVCVYVCACLTVRAVRMCVRMHAYMHTYTHR